MEQLVSIIICNYNHQQYLRESIQSALSQSHKNLEVIVVDDGSTDNSLNIIKSYGSSLTIVTKCNGGQRSAYEAGFTISRGDFVIFLDADDHLYCEAVSKLLPHFEDTAVAKVHFFMNLIQNDGGRTGGKTPRILSSGDMGKKLLSEGWLYHSSPGSGNIYRRTAVTQLFPLPNVPGDRHGADFFLIFGAVLFGQVRAERQTLANYRVDNTSNSIFFGNATKDGGEPLRHRNREEALLKLLTDRFKLNGPRLGFVSMSFSKMCLAGILSNSQISYLEKLKQASYEIRRMLRAARFDPDRSIKEKLILLFWAFSVTAQPGTPLRKYLLKKACNQASRI